MSEYDSKEFRLLSGRGGDTGGVGGGVGGGGEEEQGGCKFLPHNAQ